MASAAKNNSLAQEDFAAERFKVLLKTNKKQWAVVQLEDPKKERGKNSRPNVVVVPSIWVLSEKCCKYPRDRSLLSAFIEAGRNNVMNNGSAMDTVPITFLKFSCRFRSVFERKTLKS